MALLSALPSFGHATLLGSDPRSGVVLDTAPGQVVLTFSESARALAVHLIDASGKQTSLTDESLTAGERIIIKLPPGLPDGTQVLTWRAASSDGHPVAGSVVFSIGDTSQTPPSAVSGSDPMVPTLLWLSRAVMLAMLLLGAGSSSFRTVATALPPRARSVALIAVAVGAIATIATVPLHGLDVLGRSLADLGASEAWGATMVSSYGASVLAALIAMFLASVAIMARRPGLGRWISVSSLAAIGLTAALSGHASSADPRWLMRTMIFLHVTSIAWWAGELLPLALLLRQPEAGANPPLMRFSQFIPFVIVPLVISGLTLTAIQLGLPGPSWWTPYTYLLVAKVQLLVVLFAAAAWNRWVLTGRVMAGESAAARHLRASIFFEIVLIAAIVGVAAGWRFTAPPRAIHQEVVDRVVQMELDFDIGALHGQLTIEPGRAGSNVLTVSLLDQAGAPVPVRSVRIFLSSDELGVERIELVGREEVGGWRAEDAIVPVSGKWIVSVEVRISDFEQLHSRAAVTIEK